ncbi:amino acid adenylation domain-containing protein [Chitinophaga varians]|uniref:Amino acid adenylation domain-containing protein n=1 Tax=Chitinophaga varians TaxID=2202339 RepID=A0A847RTF7_9BACT|nr:non-ribosomal peptide synthetase [Chitinophaga varians]NLR62671.1 amino acid adenylation domain-containing protein [Chitinophaga varians]
MKNLQILLNELRKLGVQIQLVDSQLKINAPTGVLTPAYLDQIRDNKAAIIAYLGEVRKEIYQPIPRVAPMESYELSNSQKRVWVVSQFNEQSVAYNISAIYRMKGILDTNALSVAIHRLVERHESLRTVFVLRDGEPRQRIQSVQEANIKLVLHDFSDKADAENMALDTASQISMQQFDLENGPLFRLEIFRITDTVSILLCSMHHIISDEWSMQVMVREINLLYNTVVEGKEVHLPELSIQYKDYAAWQQQELAGEQFKAHRAYWLSHFEGDLPVLELPTDYNRPAMLKHQGAYLRHRFTASQTAGFQQLLKEKQATLFMGVMALVNILLYRYSGQSDLIIGTPVAGREHPDLEEQVGFYVNTLAFRNNIVAEDSFVKVLEHTRQTTMQGFTHQGYPFDLLIDELGLKRDLSRSPMFDVMVVWHSGGQDSKADLALKGMQAERLQLGDVVSKFDLTFYFDKNDDGLQLHIEYNTVLYHPSRIERMAAHLHCLLDQILQSPEMSVGELNYIPSEEQHLLLHVFNATAKDRGLKKQHLVSCFEQQVSLHPDETAFVSGEKTFSFRELDRLSNQLANRLQRSHGINGNPLIGISTARNEYLVIGILGILKAGAGYVPLDPAYPADRLDYIIEDSGLQLILADDTTSGYEGKVPVLDLSDEETLKGYADTAVAAAYQQEDIAYVIYTSGSTGRPKGVLVRQAGVVNVLGFIKEQLGISMADRWVAITTYTFDMSVVELLLPLTMGCRLIVAGNNECNMPDLLGALLETSEATVLQATPGMWNLLLESGWKGRKGLQVISGGEAMSEGLARQLLERTGRVWNMYGPTETTIFSTALEITRPDQAHLIGKPVTNTQLYILDARQQLQPVGIPGELCIAGDGLARGYLNNDLLTSDRFIPNPYGEGKLYRTGDIASWTATGEVTFYGRRDNQVKIRGYRIELGEIEESLLASGLLRQAVVTVYQNGAEKALVAYYTADNTVAVTALRSWLQNRLPQYMVPAYFMELTQFPLTSNGKVNRKALPVPQAQRQVFRAPVTDTEQALARIWEEVLGNGRVGLDDNFFEIGGHSLKVIQVNSRILRELSVKLNLEDLFVNPLLSQLSDKIDMLLWINNPVAADLSGNTDEIFL